MTEPFATLQAACGGRINPETLAQFQKAMREYEAFMALGREMFAPVEPGSQKKAAN